MYKIKIKIYSNANDFRPDHLLITQLPFFSEPNNWKEYSLPLIDTIIYYHEKLATSTVADRPKNNRTFIRWVKKETMLKSSWSYALMKNMIIIKLYVLKTYSSSPQNTYLLPTTEIVLEQVTIKALFLSSVSKKCQ